MELDELKTLWETHDRKLDAGIRLSTRLLNTPMLHKARAATTRLLIVWQVELALALIATAMLAGYSWLHLLQPRFLLPGLLLMVGSIALVCTYIRRLMAIRAIDFSGPIVTIQKQLESIRIAEIHATKWTLLLAPLAWTPFLIVVFQGLFRVDVYTHFPAAWLAGNVIFGLVVVAVERWISIRYAERMHRSPRLQRWMRDVNGYNLNAAMKFVRSAGEFEEEARA